VREVFHAEWTKLRTLASTGWLLTGVVILTVGTSAAVISASSYQPFGAYQDTTKISLTGIDLGQAVVAVLAVLTISNEYSTGMMAVTLTAMPRRLSVLAAKAACLIGLVLVGSVIAVGGSLLIGRTVLPSNGFTASHGYPLLSLAHGATLRAAVGSVLYLTLIALLSLGIATSVRGTAAAIGTVLGLLYLFPLLAHAVTNTIWQRHLEQIGPMTAGVSIQTTVNLGSLPISPWAGLGVVAAWSAAAILGGGLFLRLRDA
jgi:ABC-2 type transport system permease protein